MTQTCKEILERFLREWTSTGEEILDKEWRIKDLQHFLLIGEGVKLAAKAHKIAEAMEDGYEAEKGEQPMQSQAAAPAMAPAAAHMAAPAMAPAAAPTRPVTA